MPTPNTLITVDIPGIGKYETDAMHMDLTIMRHLPNNVLGLRKVLFEELDIADGEWKNLLAQAKWHHVCVSELLIVLASFAYARHQNEAQANW